MKLFPRIVRLTRDSYWFAVFIAFRFISFSLLVSGGWDRGLSLFVRFLEFSFGYLETLKLKAQN